MTRFIFGLAPLLLLACDPATKDGGDINGTDSGGGSASGGSVTQGTDLPTTTGETESGTTVADTDSNPSAGTDTPDTDGSSDSSTTTETEGETDGVGICVDFEPTGIGCNPPTDANAFVDTFDFPQGLSDLLCPSVQVENVDATTDRLVMDCEGFEAPLVLTVMTESPHLDLPFPATDVVLNTDENFGNVGGITVVLRSTEGDILFASVDGNDESGSPWTSPLLSPLQVSMMASGCPGYAVHEKCPAGQEITAQGADLRMSLGGAETATYSRTHAVVSDGAALSYSVIVARAQQIVCWDDGCSGDDSGPFDEARFVMVRLPEA